MQDKKNLILFANWGLGVSILDLFHRQGFKIAGIVTQYNKDEQQDSFFNAVYKAAKNNHIKVFLRYEEVLNGEVDLKNSIGICAAYNRIFNGSILKKMRIINFHPSLIPNYRGPSPIEWQLKDACRFIGVTAHFITDKIDNGGVLAQDKYFINYRKNYYEMIDDFNKFFSKFILTTTYDYLAGRLKEKTFSDAGNADTYYPKVSIPPAIRKESLRKITRFMNRPRIAFFTGNRSEFGMMFPLILELSKEYMINIFVSGAHLIKPWFTINEIEEKIKMFKMPVMITEIKMDGSVDNYTYSLSNIYEKTIALMHNKHEYKFSIVLGDRIETLGFALASFYRRIPLIHISGGDVANVAYFDTNVRHAISKLSNIHFATNDLSVSILKQLGEEEWRVHNIGNLSYDYDRLGLLSPKKDLSRELGIQKNELIFIFTYHPSHCKASHENLKDFEMIVKVLKSFKGKIIITYPNNDPGGEGIMAYLKNFRGSRSGRIKVISNMGASRFLSLLKNFRCVVVGNSSSALTETCLYCIPAVNIGDRQTDRVRGFNVFDCGVDKADIKRCLANIITNYGSLRKKLSKSKNLFGTGNSCLKAKDIIDRLIKEPRDRILFKKFVIKK